MLTDRLLSMSFRLMLLLSVSVSILMTEVIVSVMSLIFHGRITYDYLISGFITAAIVSFGIVFVIARITDQLRQSKETLAESERNLGQSEERFRCLSDATTEGVAIHYKGKILAANPAMERIFGYEQDELIGKDALELAAPESREKIINNISSGFEENYEASGLRKDGSIITGELIGKQIQFKGHPARVAIIRDITERKKTEKILSLQYKIISILAENAGLNETLKNTIKTICEHIGWELGDVWYVDRDVDILRFGGMWYADFLDGSELEVLSRKTVFRRGEGVLGLVWQKGEPVWLENLSPFSHLPRARIVAGMGFKSGFAFPIRVSGTVNGVMIFAGRTMTPPDTDLLNALSAISSQIGNFIEQKRVEEIVIKEKEFSQSLIDKLPGAVFLGDEKGNILRWSNKVEHVTGYSAEELKGMNALDLVADEQKEYVAHEMQKVLTEGSTEAEVNLLINTGEKIPYHFTGARIVINYVPYILAMGLDITERKKMESELEKIQRLESLGVLAGGIAHDFNNLLSGVLGNISLARMYLNPEDRAYKRLEEAEKASVRTKDLTGQLLTFAKGGEPVRKVISVTDLLMDSVGFGLSGSSVNCKLSVPDGCWPVNVDEGQIHQVINNLLINADQAMPQGGTIEITCNNKEVMTSDALPLDEGSYVKISIKDQGIGIPEPLLKRIFDPYFTTKEKGRGLGLATSYSILKRHNGLITVESKENAGTTFHIYLPAMPAAAINRESSEGRIISGKGRVLVMDDEDLVIQVAGEMLKALGYEVEFANDGLEAIKKYTDAKEKGKPFNAVIMDLTIPGGMGGREAIVRLKEIDPDVRAIVASGYSNDPVISDFRGFGFSGSLIKPFRIEELSRTVHSVLNH